MKPNPVSLALTQRLVPGEAFARVNGQVLVRKGPTKRPVQLKKLVRGFTPVKPV